MAPTIKNVAIAGALGNTGPAVFKKLTASGFAVTVLSRSAAPAKAKLGEACKVAEVDYLDHESLVAALKGQDAVVSCGVSMIREQTNLIDAAIAAGVSRFVPADFGGDLAQARNRALHVNKNKVHAEEYLKAHEGQISHTSIRTGPLFDFCMPLGVLLNMRERSQRRYDDGEKRFSTTTTGTAAAAIATALGMGDKSANRAYVLQDFTTTQNELLRMGKELAPGDEWTVTPVSTAELAAKAEEIFKTDPESRMGTIMQREFLMFGADAQPEHGLEDDRELGIAPMDEAQIKALLKTYM